MSFFALKLDSNYIGHRLFVVVLISGMLFACSDDRMSDLHKFVEDVKAEKHGHIEPLPEFKPFETFVYKADEIRDPFAKCCPECQEQPDSSGGTPA